MSASSGPQSAVGVDVIEIERVEAALGKFGERFLRRVYTAEEAAFCRGRVHELAARFSAKEAGMKALGRGGGGVAGGRAHELAARFSAREAVMKALGTGARGVAWSEIEVLPNHRGKPLVYLYGRARARAKRSGPAGVGGGMRHSGG